MQPIPPSLAPFFQEYDIARLNPEGEPYLSHECYVDGIHCYADQGHFGGLVIRPV